MRRYLPLGVGLGVFALVVAALYFAAGSWAGIDRLRTDYLAIYHVSRALEATQKRPLDRNAVIHHVDRALALAPDAPMVRKAAPDAYVAVGAYDKALAQLRRQAGPDPYALGLCLVKTGSVTEGTALLTASLKTVEDLSLRKAVSDEVYAMQLNNVGYVLADAGVRLDEARHMLELASSMLPLDANVTDSLGWLYFRLGDGKRAVFYLERAARHVTGAGVAEIQYHLGAAYAREGKTRRARKLLLSALRLDPGHTEAEAELRKLRWRLPGPDYAQDDAA